ncbi:hypothetical protein B0H13DRAFT_1987279, partial [Mycena leptocephala]
MKVRVCPILSSLPVFAASSLVAALPLAGIALQAITCQVLHLLVPIRNLSGLAPTISTASWTGADVGGRWLCCADGELRCGVEIGLGGCTGVPPTTQKQGLSCI